MKRLPQDAAERGATRYSMHANHCEADVPARGRRPKGYWGCTRKPHKHGDHIASDGKYIRARWSATHTRDAT